MVCDGCTLSCETLPDETIRRAKFSSQNEKFVTFLEKKLPSIKKVSLVEIQMNLKGKQVIYTNCDYIVGRNFVG